MKHKFFQLTAKSFDELGVATHKDLWEKVKAEGYTALQLGIKTILTKAKNDNGDEEENKFHAVLSDSLEDRHGDVVIQEWVLSHFKKNPVLLDSHDYSSIEYIIGRWLKIEVADKKLQGDIEFALSNPRGQLAYDLAKGGFLTALSAGFIPLEFGEKGEIKKSELLEGSMVSVPANPRTLMEKGIEGEGVTTPKEEEQEEVTPPATEPVEKKIEPVLSPAAKAEESMIYAMKRELDRRVAREKAIVHQLAKEMSGLNKENVDVRKRNIWKSLRQLM